MPTFRAPPWAFNGEDLRRLTGCPHNLFLALKIHLVTKYDSFNNPHFQDFLGSRKIPPTRPPKHSKSEPKREATA